MGSIEKPEHSSDSPREDASKKETTGSYMERRERSDERKNLEREYTSLSNQLMSIDSLPLAYERDDGESGGAVKGRSYGMVKMLGEEDTWKIEEDGKLLGKARIVFDERIQIYRIVLEDSAGKMVKEYSFNDGRRINGYIRSGRGSVKGFELSAVRKLLYEKNSKEEVVPKQRERISKEPGQIIQLHNGVTLRVNNRGGLSILWDSDLFSAREGREHTYYMPVAIDADEIRILGSDVCMLYNDGSLVGEIDKDARKDFVRFRVKKGGGHLADLRIYEKE